MLVKLTEGSIILLFTFDIVSALILIYSFRLL